MPEQDVSPDSRRSLGRCLRLMLRYSAIHGLTVLIYSLNLVLAVVSLTLGYLLVREDVEIPDLLKGRIERELAARGIDATFESAHIDAAGRLLVRNLRVVPPRFGEPIITADFAYVQMNQLLLAAARFELSHLYAENIRVFCPAMLSPGGTSETIVHIAGIDLTNHSGRWILNGLAARFGPVTIAAEGTLGIPKRRDEKSPPPSLAGILQRFADIAPKCSRVIHELKPLEGGHLEIHFNGVFGRPVRVSVDASAESWFDPRIGEIRNVTAHFDREIGWGATGPAEITASIGSLERATGQPDESTGLLHLDHAGVHAAWASFPTADNFLPGTVELTAARIVHPKITLIAPTVVVHPARWPLVKTEASIEVQGEVLTAAATVDAKVRNATAVVRGRVGRTWLSKASEILGKDLTDYATIEEPPDIVAHVEFDDGFKLRCVEFRAIAPAFVARGVAIDRARVDGRLESEDGKPARLHIDRLEIAHGDEWAVGTYEDDLRTRDYRFVLSGAMRPLEISPWFSAWWRRFWDDYTFDGPPPGFYSDIHSNWLAGHKLVVEGRGDASHGTIKTVGYDELHTRYFIRPDHYDLYDMSVVRPEGRVDGDLLLNFHPITHEPALQKFQFTSTVDLVDLARIFGKGGEEMLAPYRYTTPPQAIVDGIVTNESGHYDTQLAIEIETDHEFRFHDFPLSSLSTQVTIHNDHVDIPRLRAGYADGILRGTAVADAGRLSVDGSLSNSDYDAAIDIFTDFLNRRSPPPPDEAGPSGFAGRKAGGKLSLTLKAEGPATQFNAYDGAGTVHVDGANLGSVNILGLLADLLRPVGIKVGALNFHEANGTFDIKRERIVFSKMKLSGRTAALDSEGAYFINDGNVDFTARLFPLSESSGAITQIVGIIMDPFSFLLEVRLTGTLRKPHWSLSRMPFGAAPHTEVPGKPGTAEQPTDSSSPVPPAPDQAPATPAPEAPRDSTAPPESIPPSTPEATPAATSGP